MPPSATKGRPRKSVASLDAEAAERRRTQLRVAQRAFRKRREATTDELREQVNELQNVHDGLLASIRDQLRQPTLERGDNDGLAHALESLLAKYITPPNGEKSEDVDGALPAVHQLSGKARNSHPAPHSAVGATSDAAHPNNITAPTQGDIMNTIDTLYTVENSLLDHGLPFNLSWSAPNDLPELLLQPLQPYGYDEAPFSIRLRRRGIQAGYQ